MKFDIKNVIYDTPTDVKISIGDEVFFNDDLDELEGAVKDNDYTQRGILTAFDGNVKFPFSISQNNEPVYPARFIYPVKIAETGKSFAVRKRNYIESKKDFYPTPKSLTYELLNTGVLNDCKTILEPAVGTHAVSNILLERGFQVTEKDIIYGNDFLNDDYSGQKFDAIVTNPPFSLIDDFIEKAKQIDCKKIVFICRTNHLGSHKANDKKIWEGLSDVFVFDRMVDYDKPFREDGKFKTGMLVTGWFVWTKGYNGPARLKVLDVQKWFAKAGDDKKAD